MILGIYFSAHWEIVNEELHDALFVGEVGRIVQEGLILVASRKYPSGVRKW